ncbi:MAG: nicotinamide-nucleotide adenylyltransferase [Candidatus Micrarchaeota archaeon]|nr:nicotinamide-nucleotide adenylyltransferase [Candidatus Micrarchaeota archaeon]
MAEGKAALFIGRRKPAGSARQKQTALFIGRFQPLHKGHLFALKYIAARFSRVIVVIGSAQEKRTEKNPFSAQERKRMMRAMLVKEKLSDRCRVFLLQDIPNDYEWVSYLDAHVPSYDVCFSNNALVLRLMRRSGKKVMRVPLLARRKYRGATVRERMRKGKEWKSRVPESVAKSLAKMRAEEMAGRL